MPIEPLSFDRAQYGEASRIPAHCIFCGRGIDDLLFEMDSRPVCSACASMLVSSLPEDTHRTFIRAAGVGILAALASSLAYFLLLRQLWQMNIGNVSVLAAIPVGWIVGKAMSTVAHGVGGRRYQWTGAVLAYAAVVYPLQFLVMGPEKAWWLYPFILLRPIAFLFTGLRMLGALQILAAFVSIRWEWMLLRGQINPLRNVQRQSTNDESAA